MRGGREVAQLRRSEAECETRGFIFRALFYSSSITPPLYRTPLETGAGDGSCWNEDYHRNGQISTHPNTRGVWRVESLNPPPPGGVEFMYEIEDVRVDRSSWTNEQSVAICGSEDAIRVVIPDKYGAVWCYDELEGKFV